MTGSLEAGGPGPRSLPGGVHLKIVGRFADRVLHLASISRDLEFAETALRRLEVDRQTPDSATTPDEFSVLDIALWQAAAIAYARCFTTGRRYAEATGLVPAGAEDLEIHRELLAVRDAHLAHFDRRSDREAVGALVELNVDDGHLLFGLLLNDDKELLPTAEATSRFAEFVARASERAAVEMRTAADALMAALTRSRTEEQLLNLVQAGRDSIVRLDS